MLLKIIYIFLKNKFLYFFDNDQCYKNILFDLSKLNIIFIKIFQWLYAEKFYNNDFLKKNLKIYSSNSPYTNDEIDHDLINLIIYSYKKHNYEININTKPINSGSINLIFKGKLDNKDIILKINRKNIKDKVFESINLFDYLNNFKALDFYSIIDLVNENKKFLIDQVDLEIEKENQLLFYNKLIDYDIIKIPKIYNDENIDNKLNMNISNKKSYIIMEQINNFYDSDNIEEKDKNIFSDILVKVLYIKIHIIKLMHGDLHHGNILFVIENNKHKICLLDFGIIQKINIEMGNHLYNTIKCKNKKDFLINTIKFINSYDKENNHEKDIYNLLITKYKKFIDFDNLAVSKNEMLYVLKSFKYYNVKYKKELIAYLNSCAVIEGIVKKFTNKLLHEVSINQNNKYLKELDLDD